MDSLWSFLSAPKNQKTLSWIGGGIVVVIAGLWAAFLYFFPPKDEHHGSIKVEAGCGSAAVQGTMIGSSITTGGASSTADCPPKSK